MPPGVAFVLYLVIGPIVVFLFLILCVKISVFIEDTCPTRFCLKRKQRQQRKTLIHRILHPEDYAGNGESPRGAPPSDENITAEIICQPYIYRDAYSTGLTGLNMLANLPLTFAHTTDGNPSDAINTTNSEQMRVTFRRTLPQVLTPPLSHSEITVEVSDDDEDDKDSLPPDYLNVMKQDSKDNDALGEEGEQDEAPPPSYYQCVNSCTNKIPGV